MSATRRVVSDTGPVISLEKLSGGFGFIRKLYDVIVIPPSVLRELVQGQFESADAYLLHFGVADLFEVREPVSSSGVSAETRHLDEGERDAIQLAMETGLSLLIEEQAGRQTAQRLGPH